MRTQEKVGQAKVENGADPNFQEREQSRAFSLPSQAAQRVPGEPLPGLEGDEVAQAFLYTTAAKSCKAELKRRALLH